MLEGNDFVQNISIDTNENERLLMWKIRDHLHLIIVVDATVKEREYCKEVTESLELMEKRKLKSCCKFVFVSERFVRYRSSSSS